MAGISQFPTKKTRRGRSKVPDSVSGNTAVGNAFMELARATEITNVSLEQLTQCAPDPTFPGATPIVVHGETEMQLRRLIAHFGFPRLPFTLEELKALTNYCQTIAAPMASINSWPKVDADIWKEVTIETFNRYFPVLTAGFEHYSVGNIEALKAHHTEEFYGQIVEWWTEMERRDRLPAD